MKKSSILITDDDKVHRTMLKTLIKSWGYEAFETDDGDKAVQMIEKRPFDLVLMDIRMIKVSGIEALSMIREFNPAIPIVIMTAYSSVETAVSALKKGAYDYLTKPLDFEKLKIIIRRATEHAHLKSENIILKKHIAYLFDTQNIIGRSEAMTKTMEKAAQVAMSQADVLITGESGVGKELIANLIHNNSERKDKPFIKINCAAIPETLLESELFGHEKGAFTGAYKSKKGSFLLADKGSLFLDEVAEMPFSMQAKLLRVIQEREVQSVGGEKTFPINVRIIAATNKHIPTLTKEEKFREDLYYRLNVVEVEIPPLRKRREDIPMLAQHFLKKFIKKNKKEIKGITPEAMDVLIRYDWRGNVRELMNAIERSVVLSTSYYLGLSDFSFIADKCKEKKYSSYDPIDEITKKNMNLKDIEKIAIAKALEAAGGNKTKAAKQLGITRKTLHKKIES